MSNQEEKEQFKKYEHELLDAQTYDFLEEHTLFSRDTLKEILVKFCDIIAKHTKADSCTINLKLYGPDYIKFIKILEQDMENKLGEVSQKYPFENKDLLIKNRKEFYTSIQTFPYWNRKYQKGASILAAANKKGPWYHVLDEMGTGLGIADLRSGVSKHIYQDNIAMIEDRLSIRSTRNLRKIGGADKFVWKNTDWNHIFKNFYGVPIRIHSGGEVVGILKIENKETKFGEDLEKLLKDKNHQDNVKTFRDRIIDEIGKRNRSYKKLKDLINNLKVSLLSLVYLEKDLSTDECKNKKLSLHDLLFITYPEYGIEIKWEFDEISFEMFSDKMKEICSNFEPNKFKYDREQRILSFKGNIHEAKEIQKKLNNNLGENIEKYKKVFEDVVSKANQNLEAYETLKPKDENTRPPIQLITKNLDDEKNFWFLLLNKDSGKKNKTKKTFASNDKSHNKKIKKLFELVKDFYDTVEESLKRKRNLCKKNKMVFDLKMSLKNIIASYLKTITLDNIDVKSWKTDNDSNHLEGKQKLPDFYFEVTIKTDDKEIPLYIFIPPNPSEISTCAFIGDKAKSYQVVNKYWASKEDFPNTTPPVLETKGGKNGGVYNGEFIEYGPPGKKIIVTDLLLDRLAARIQAFVFAFPVEDFNKDDTLKLSWASYEIGKLIEREISYRANRSSDPIPLTAMEFFRIPISDFSFIDDLRSRRKGLIRNQKFLDHHIESLIFDMKMRDTIDYKSRVKEYRSALLRLGERYEGYVRGNIAVWVYLLSIDIEPGKEGNSNKFDELEMQIKKIISEKLEEVNEELNNSIKKDTDNGFYSFIKNKHEFLKEKLSDEKVDGKKISDFYLKCKEYLLKKSLVLFKNKVENIPDTLPKKDKEKHKEIVDFFNKERTSIIGDLKFSSPPFECDDNDNIQDAFNRICENLINEQFLINKDTCIEYKQELLNNVGNNAIDKDTRKELEDLLFRNYDDFAGDSFSLLAQIINKNKYNNGDKPFNKFYKFCFELRGKFCTSVREIEDDPQLAALKDVFGKNGDDENPWRFIMDFIDENDTEEFCKIFNKNTSNYLYLDLPGIYKRIRSLYYVLLNQRSVASLDWELGRYDLSGCRANCLFKNQVFAIYEYIWNKGDPFFQYDINKKPFKEFHNEKTQADPINRLYWLCLRTNVLQGEYNSLQIATLIDPKASTPGYWGESTYNLKKVRSVLGSLFSKFDKGSAIKYKIYASKRNNIRITYREWYNIFNAISRDKIALDTANTSIWFSSFLFEGVFDLLIFLCDKGIENKDRDVYISEKILKCLGEIISSLEYVIIEGKKYTDAVKKWFGELSKNSNGELSENFNIEFKCNPNTPKKSENTLNKTCGSATQDSMPENILCKTCGNATQDSESLWNGPGKNGCLIYKKADDLLGHILETLDEKKKREEKKNERDMIEATKKLLNKEKEYFTKSRKKDDIDMPIPLFYLDWDFNKSAPCAETCTMVECTTSTGKDRDNCALQAFKDIIKKLNDSTDKKRYLSISDYQFLVRMFTLIRRGQKAYLFYKEEPPKKPDEAKEENENNGKKEKNPGLWMREKENVLNRIKNYILLFDPNDPTSDKKEKEKEKEKENNSEFAGWTAYDLYYYVRSLVPVEIQVRTELSNTFAEQYHDAIYKGHPPLGTEFPRNMITEIAKKLDNIDVETEIDFEDYISRYYLSMQKTHDSS